MRNNELSSILDVKVKCLSCNWTGVIGDTEPNIDGSLGCPKCFCSVVVVKVKDKETLYIGLSIWLALVGAAIALFGQAVEITGAYLKRLGVKIVDHSFKYDLYIWP